MLAYNFGHFSPNDNAMPFGAFLFLAFFVFPVFAGGHTELSDGLTAWGITNFRIPT